MTKEDDETGKCSQASKGIWTLGDEAMQLQVERQTPQSWGNAGTKTPNHLIKCPAKIKRKSREVKYSLGINRV